MNIALPEEPKLLVVLLGSLGDVARGLAIVDPIKKKYPKAKFSWLVEPKSTDLVKLHPRIDRVIVFNRASGWRGIQEVYKTFSTSRFDICIDMQRHFKSGFFSRISRAPLRLGFHPADSKELNYFFNTHYLPRLGAELPKLMHYLYFVEALGCETAKEIYERGVSFGYSENRPENLISSELHHSLTNSGRPILGIGLGTSWSSKNWPKEGYLELLKCVKADFLPVLLGDRSQTVLALDLAKECPQAVDLCGKLSVRELVGVCNMLKAYVGPDSGPAHIAAACHVPCITLFGPTNPGRVAPYRNSDRVQRAALACSGCGRKVCPGLDTLCMRLVDPKRVYEAIREVPL